ncbi:MAG: hypothetical protein AABY18_07950 [Candidatus Thermoplasmatota archaeon]
MSATDETKADRKARLQEEKAAAKAAKQEAKLAEAEAKAQAKADKKAAKKAGKEEAPAAAPAADADETLDAKWERYNQLRANVRRRRTAYGLAILFGVLVFLATAWDIVFNESAYQWYLLPIFAAIILWEVILFFSRRRHLQEVAELEAMHRTYLECETCNSVFQFGELRFSDRKRVGFSCPVCGEDSALPGPGATPVERVLPEANVIETTYACGNCSEQIVVGTFGGTPRETRFRACPSCGERGQVGLA